jgi:hypothetical protein
MPAYASGMTDERSRQPMVEAGGRKWRVGTGAEVAWIAEGTSVSRAITAAIPPVFGAYATVVVPDNYEEHARVLLALLTEQSPPPQRWWLGYPAGNIFPGQPTVTLYAGWEYVLVEAGAAQAAAWGRDERGPSWELPSLMFPAHRSWLVSTLWDDDWTCIGGPVSLVDRILAHPQLEARQVTLGEDATPPGHQAY